MMRGNRCVAIWGSGLCQDSGIENVRALGALISYQNGMMLPAWNGGNVQGLLATGCLAVHGTNPIYNLDNIRLLYTTQPLQDIPDQVETVIAQDVYHSVFLKTANVVLPAAVLTEEQGSILDMAGQRQSKGARPSSNIKQSPMGFGLQEADEFVSVV